VVLTIGTFDVFHEGHLNLLRRCRKLAGDGKVIVGVNSDDFCRTYKPMIAQSYGYRHRAVANCGYVDEALPNVDAGKNLIRQVRPDWLVIGSDWAARDYLAQIDVTEEWLAERGIDLLYTPYTTGISSTLVRALRG